MSRHLLLFKTVKRASVLFSTRNISHKFNRKSINTFLLCQVLKNVSNHRFKSGAASFFGSQGKLIATGLAIVGSGIGAYYYINKSEPPVIVLEEDVVEDPPFVYEHLEEDLKLLEEYGKIPYLLIGAGSASFSAYKAIRTEDPNAKILMIGEEPYYPYMRPPLSKEMWFDPKEENVDSLTFTQWDGENHSLFYEPPEYFFPLKEILDNKNGGLSVIRGTKIVRVDPVTQTAYLSSGGQIKYEKCLIATGSKPKNISVFKSADNSVEKHVSLFRNASDFKKINNICKNSNSIVIVGGGFLGSELACGIVKRHGSKNFKVIQLFPEPGNLGKYIPEYLSKWTTKKLIDDGIKVLSDVSIKSAVKDGNQLTLVLSNDQIIKTDHVIVAVGSEANTDIAKSSGLEVDEKIGGFVVNTEMEARKNLWVAGDASCFYDIILGRRRVEHQNHASVSGKLAGKNMTGCGEPYKHQSMFWSDLGPEIGFEAIGIVDSSLPTVGIFVNDAKPVSEREVNPVSSMKDGVNPALDSTLGEVNSETALKTGEELSDKSKPLQEERLRTPDKKDNYDRGIIFYLKNNIIVGIVTWNVFSKMSIARKILNECKSYDNLTEVAKLFELNPIEDLD